MASGTPVIALAAGGAVDTVVPESTGVLVPPGSDQEIIEGLASAIRAFDPSEYDPVHLRRWAELFSRANFRAKMQRVLEDVVG